MSGAATITAQRTKGRPGAAQTTRHLPALQEPRSDTRFLLLACIALPAVVAAYANHFQNSFHFDDAHAVVNNVYIRDLRNVPRFFKDGRTFSSFLDPRKILLDRLRS